MKIITIILHYFVLCVFLQGCDEYEMIEYGEGGEINFMSDYYLGQNSKPSWRDDVEKLHYEVNFGINPLGDSLLMDTLLIGVKISGIYADYPRKIVFTTKVPEQNALEVIYPDEYYVPADTGIAQFRILLKRPEIRNVEYTADLTFDYEKSDFKAGTAERQVFKLKVQNTVNMELWGTYKEEWDDYYSIFFGPYSETKARYLITKYGCTKLNEWAATDTFITQWITNVFYKDLEAYKANPANKPLIDENTGEWISIPKY